MNMIRVNLIRKAEVKGRISKGLPTYGVIWCWEEIFFVDLLNEKMRKAFLDRFPGRMDGIYYASGFLEFDKGKDIDLEPGKCIIHEAKFKQLKTTKTFYKYYCHNEEEYFNSFNGEYEEDDF